MDSKEIGERIRLIRERRGLSLKDLANSLRISSAYLSQMETNKRDIDAKLVYRIAVELKVAVEELYPKVGEVESIFPYGKEITRFKVGNKTFAICEVNE